MTNAALLAFIHHLAAFILFACLFFQHLVFKPGLTLETARKLARIDMIYGASAGIVLLVGFLRVLYFEKGAAFYMNNTAFFIKLGAFLLVGVLSAYPTKVFFSWRKDLRDNRLPAISDGQTKAITMILRLEVLGIIVVLLAAAMMAKGIGY